MNGHRRGSADPTLTAEKTRAGSGWLVAVVALVIAVYAADMLFGVLPAALSEVFKRYALPVVFAGSASLCALRARSSRQEASAWWLFSLSLALWGAGSFYYGVEQGTGTQVPVPSLADGLWIAFYVPAYAALFQLLRRRAGKARRDLWLDALVAALGVGGAGAAIAFQSIAAHTQGTEAAVLTTLAYPIGDLGLLALVVAAITVVGPRASATWRLIGVALAAFVVADSVYLVQVGTGTYEAGGIIDLGWPVAALLIGTAAWRSRDAVRSDVREKTTILVPAVSGLLALALLVSDHFRPLNLLALALAAATIIVILGRLYATVRDNIRLLTESQREALTDALTHLGNRRQLQADLSSHLGGLDPAGRPLMLTLFDLDGFKAYNDTFGHPAGDQLLERLAGRLSTAVAGQGSAYRMGGDEFCTLWRLDDVEDALEQAARASAALTEHGEVFSIECSHGSVLLPDETSDPTDALRIADQRLYMSKGSGRVSTGRQISDVLSRAVAERDIDLGCHVRGVADLVTPIAQMLGVAPENLEAARQTALLHDIGKVAIPDAILQKPGPLDEREWQFVKRHTLIGERIISAAPALADVARLVRHTHERHDGAGYPDGLAGDDIPLISRIVAVCDAYDAILSTRPYRTARDQAAALAELRRCSGTQFHPAVVRACVALVEGQQHHTGKRLAEPAPIGAGR